MDIKNVHQSMPPPEGNADIAMIDGDYVYYHYGCDGFDDRGWGCGYRTLQTLCSWVQHKQAGTGRAPRAVPSIPDIQKALVTMEDKQASFMGSKQWIGSVEVGLTVDFHYDVPCKIIHVNQGSDLVNYVDEILEHFKTKGSPIMMGGESDNASKGILGICKGKSCSHFLILDPHYYGPQPDQQILMEHQMLLWRPVDSFVADSFYNLCLPQYKNR